MTMYDESNVPAPEYRVRTVVRYIVTRYCHPYTDRNMGQPLSIEGSSRVIAEFHREQDAIDVASSLAAVERGQVSV
jgi:hypothetical protein